MPKATWWIADALGGRQDVFMVQIGSNDGKTYDPLYPLLMRNPTWGALLVEPVPFLFQRLRETYGPASRFRFANVAVGESDGHRPLYYLDPAARSTLSDLPPWYEQIGSFDRAHITKHFGAKYDAFLVELQVPVFSLGRLLEHHQVGRMDLLHIDAEGHDWRVLRQLDLKRHRPEVILFEHCHLADETRAAARTFLANDYHITDLGADFFCKRARPPG
jgi:FkbM family methyltransferase